MRSRRLWLAAAFAAGPAAAAVAWWRAAEPKNHLAYSAAVVAGFVVVVLWLLELASKGGSDPERRKLGYLAITLGADGRVSNSKTMVALWTLVLASALVLLSAMVWFTSMTPDEAFGTEWDAYFLLLGGPFAAAVLAKAITVSKADEGQKSTMSAAAADLPKTDATSPKLGDLSRNDSGEMSLPDTQYWVFSLVAILYFVGAFLTAIKDYADQACQGAVTTDCTTIALPEIPPALLGLTSLAALTYVGAKAVAKDGLRIARIDPIDPVAGRDVKVSLVNAETSLTANHITAKFTNEAGTVTTPPVGEVTSDALMTSFVIQAPAAGTYDLVVITPKANTETIKVAVAEAPAPEATSSADAARASADAVGTRPRRGLLARLPWRSEKDRAERR